MKARVKATGEIVEVYPSIHKGCDYDGSDGYSYVKEDIIILDDEPDYWTRLEHTYAGMAMQGIVNTFNNRYRDSCALRPNITRDQSEILLKESARATAEVCYYFAHALVEKMKEESK